MTKEHNPVTCRYVDFDKTADRLNDIKKKTLYHFGSDLRWKNRRGGLSIRTSQRFVMHVPAVTLASMESDLLLWSEQGKVGLTRFGREIAAVLRNREAALREARQAAPDLEAHHV